MLVEILKVTLVGVLPLVINAEVSQDEELGCVDARKSGIDPNEWDGIEKTVGIGTSFFSGLLGSDPEDACSHGAAAGQTLHDLRKGISIKDDSTGNEENENEENENKDSEDKDNDDDYNYEDSEDVYKSGESSSWASEYDDF